jgi:hypothetical protein
MNDMQDISGTVWAVFGHRLAIEETGGRRCLADLGPKGGETLAVAVGDAVSLKGERKPTEIKVTSIALNQGAAREIAWPVKPDHGEADPSVALAAAEDEGYAVVGEPKRKPKHFEIVGTKDGARHELHVAFDGRIRKMKPLGA